MKNPCAYKRAFKNSININLLNKTSNKDLNNSGSILEIKEYQTM